MAESVIRFRRGRGFTTIYNSVAQDTRLGLATRGLFTLMASLPQDWDYSVSGLAVKAKTSRYEVRKCLENLQEVGYLAREQIHDSGGKFSGNVYVLQDEPPTVVPNCRNGESRQRCLTLSVNLTQQRKDLNKEKKNKTPIAPKATPAEVQNAIDEYAGDDAEFKAAIRGFLECREKRKNPILTERAIHTLLNKLQRLSPRRDLQIAMLDNATEHNWDSVYPLKADEIIQATVEQLPDDRRGRFL